MHKEENCNKCSLKVDNAAKLQWELQKAVKKLLCDWGPYLSINKQIMRTAPTYPCSQLAPVSHIYIIVLKSYRRFNTREYLIYISLKKVSDKVNSNSYKHGI